VEVPLVEVGQDLWLTANYRGWVVRVVVAVLIERSKHGADRRLGMWCAVLDGTQDGRRVNNRLDSI
jgi:hypothetical protein